MTTKSFAEQILFLIKNEELYNNLEEKHMGHRSLKKCTNYFYTGFFPSFSCLKMSCFACNLRKKIG